MRPRSPLNGLEREERKSLNSVKHEHQNGSKPTLVEFVRDIGYQWNIRLLQVTDDQDLLDYAYEAARGINPFEYSLEAGTALKERISELQEHARRKHIVLNGGVQVPADLAA